MEPFTYVHKNQMAPAFISMDVYPSIQDGRSSSSSFFKTLPREYYLPFQPNSKFDLFMLEGVRETERRTGIKWEECIRLPPEETIPIPIPLPQPKARAEVKHLFKDDSSSWQWLKDGVMLVRGAIDVIVEKNSKKSIPPALIPSSEEVDQEKISPLKDIMKWPLLWSRSMMKRLYKTMKSMWLYSCDSIRTIGDIAADKIDSLSSHVSNVLITGKALLINMHSAARLTIQIQVKKCAPALIKRCKRFLNFNSIKLIWTSPFIRPLLNRLRRTDVAHLVQVILPNKAHPLVQYLFFVLLRICLFISSRLQF